MGQLFKLSLCFSIPEILSPNGTLVAGPCVFCRASRDRSASVLWLERCFQFAIK